MSSTVSTSAPSSTPTSRINPTNPSAGDRTGPAVATTRSELESLRIVPARHPGRWLAVAAVAVLLAMVASSLATNARWEWSVVVQYLTWPSVLSGLWGTLRLTAVAAVIGFGLGTVLALMRLSRSPLLQSVSWGYTWIFRSVPLILQLLLWYNLAYLYPTLSLGIPFGPEVVEFGTLDVINKFGRPEYEQLLAKYPVKPPLDNKAIGQMFDKWDREIGADRVQK